jgi:hypothetical protein
MPGALFDERKGTLMNNLFSLKAVLVAASVLLLPLAQAATMTKAACAGQAGNAKDICVEEAKAKEKVARAELEYAYTGKSSDRNKVLVAKAETGYAVAKERCYDKAGNAKAVCVKEAKAVEIKGLADARWARRLARPRPTPPKTARRRLQRRNTEVRRPVG